MRLATALALLIVAILATNAAATDAARSELLAPITAAI